MGGQQSTTHHASRFLESASSPMPQGVILPPPPRRPVLVTVPQRTRGNKQLQPGDTFPVEVEEKKKILVKVPEGATPGQQMQVLIPEYSQMLASTLTAAPPGCKVFLEHPIIVANVSHQIQGPTKETASSKKVTSLMKKAQRDLLRKAYFAGCNAVLGIKFNVTTTSTTTATGITTLAMVSAYGTPCIVAGDPNSPERPNVQETLPPQEQGQGTAPVPLTAANVVASQGPGSSLLIAELEPVDQSTEYSDNEDCDSNDDTVLSQSPSRTESRKGGSP